MELQTALFVYFSAEKIGAVIKFTLATAALLGSLYVYKQRDEAKGFAYVAGFIFLSQVIVGGTIFFRTDHQVAGLIAAMNTDLSAMLAAETARMRVVVASFATYRALQLFFVALGIALLLLGRAKTLPKTKGAGLGFAGLGAMLFCMDLLAAQRANVYLEALTR